jgi:hypothetical protein
MWFVPRGEVPIGEEEVAEWLNAWWARLDEWIGARGEETSPAA